MPSFTATNSVDVVGSQVVTGGLTIGAIAQGTEVAAGLKVTTGGATIDSGGLTVTLGGATVSAGGLTVSAGAATVPYLSLTGISSDVNAGARFVGGIASGAPLGGSYLVGDVVVDRTGKIWICTTAGSPGTWTQVSGTGGGGGSSGTTTNALTIGTGLSGTSFNGSAPVTIALASTTVSAGSYTAANITVDAQGRITSASSGSASWSGDSSVFSISSDGLIIGIEKTTLSNVIGTAPVSVAIASGAATISMAAATTSANGYLTSTDWNTFNGKTTLAVTVAAANTWTAAQTFNDGLVIPFGKVISSPVFNGANGGLTAGTTYYVKLFDFTTGSVNSKYQSYFLKFKLLSYAWSEYSADVEIFIPSYAFYEADAGIPQVTIKEGGITSQSETFKNILITGTISNTTFGGQVWLQFYADNAARGIDISTYPGSSVVTWTGQTTTAPSNIQKTVPFLYNYETKSAGLNILGNIRLPGSTSGSVQITPAAFAGTGTILTLPATTGTVVTTGDSSTVTSAMLSGSIANAKLSNSSVTVNGSSIALGGSATVTANTTNALTIGTGLSGTASTFNGSAANTVSIDYTNANTWTAIQTFSPSLSTYGTGTRLVDLNGSFTGSSNDIAGFRLGTLLNPSASIANAWGFRLEPTFTPANSTTLATVATHRVAGATGSTTGLITTFYNLLIQASYGTIKPTTAYGAYIENHGSASITNSYGLYVAAQSGSTNSYSAIFAGGNVGIGTTTPAYKLEIVKSNPASLGAIARFYHGPASDRSIEFGVTGQANYLPYVQARNTGSATHDLALQPEGGWVGIGTTGPAFDLDISKSTVGEVGLRIQNTSAASTSYTILRMGNDAVATKFVIFTNSSTRTGDGGVGTTTLRTDNGNLRIGTAGTLQFNLPTAPAVGQVLAATDTSGTVGWTTVAGGALSGVVYIGSSSVSAATQALEIGGQRTGNGYALLDLIGDATYTDFGFRMLRGDTGPNTWSVLDHRGTGDFQLRAVDAAPITFSTTNAERMRITASGNVVVGSGEGTATLAGNTMRGPSAAGTNIAGGSFTVAGGAGTGTGSGGNITFKTALTGITGSSSNAFMDRMSITPNTFYVQKQKLSGIDATVSWTTVTTGAISSVLSVGTAGSGYLVGDRVYVNSGNYDAVIAVSAVSSGQVTGWSLVSGGTGYTANGTGISTVGYNRSAHVFGFATTETILYSGYDKQGNTSLEIAAYGNGSSSNTGGDLGFPNLVFSSNALGPGSVQTSPYLGMITWAARNTSFADKRVALFGGELEANSTTTTFGRFMWHTSSGAGIEERMRLTSGGTLSIGASSPSTASRLVASTSTGSGATATWTTFSGGAITGTVSAPVTGSGYAVGDQVRVSGAGNGDAILRVATLTGSGVATWTLISGGTGYTAAGTGVATGFLYAASFLGGNVGIGTNAPAGLLHVADATTGGIVVGNNNSSQKGIYFRTTYLTSGATQDYALTARPNTFLFYKPASTSVDYNRFDYDNVGSIDSFNPVWSGVHFGTEALKDTNGSTTTYPRVSMYHNYNTVTAAPNNLTFNVTPLNAGSVKYSVKIDTANSGNIVLTPQGTGVVAIGANATISTSGSALVVEDNNYSILTTLTSSSTSATYISLTNTSTSGRQYLIGSTGTANGQGAGLFVIWDNTASANRFAISSAGNVGIGTTSPGTALEVYGSITARPATTNDAVIIAGRAGGTSSFSTTLISGTLTASRTITLPDVTGTMITKQQVFGMRTIFS